VQVFDTVARDLVLEGLQGVNGTVFAYGQTGSGKTFTITGGPEHYADRGIIPRSISLLFRSIAEHADCMHAVLSPPFPWLRRRHTCCDTSVLRQVHISYLEIYNEAGYDLLDPDREARVLEDLPRVHVMEDEAGRIHMRNLSMHRAATEEEALNLVICARFSLV
jgi:kinesin family protein 6/9